MSIVVIGSSATDMINFVPHLPKPGETIIGTAFQTAAGGKGANQAVAAARLNSDVTLLSSIGQDHFGDQCITGFKKDRLNTNHLKRPEGQSGVALIFVADNGQNSIAVVPASNALLDSEYLLENEESVIKNASYLLTQLETPIESIMTLADLAQKHDIPLILDPAPAPKEALPQSLLKKVAILTPNECEAEMLTGIAVSDIDSAHKAAQILLDKGVKTAILTLGEKGALIAQQGQPFELVSGIHVDAQDTTGAGDVFNGALASALSSGKTLKQAVEFANCAAAISVTRKGAQPSAPYPNEVLEMVNQIYG